ncbi:hypothetical protein L195_g062316, partial [Trifolium pratense]
NSAAQPAAQPAPQPAAQALSAAHRVSAPPDVAETLHVLYYA